MASLGGPELLLVVIYPIFLLIPLAVLYLIIRQAVLSALRKFYRELDDPGRKKIQAHANL